MAQDKYLFFIDDDDSFLYLLERTCNSIDAVSKTTTANHGQAALDKINAWLADNETLPDIMFVDLNMPVMDGFEFLEAFKGLKAKAQQLNKIVPIVVLTSSQQESDAKKVIETGIVDKFIYKPGDVQTMTKMLEDIIEEI